MLLDEESAFIGAYLTWARPVAFGTTMAHTGFRGHADIENWRLLPTLCRRISKVHLLKQWEGEIIESFKSQYGLDNWSDINVLAYARHHGAPTRLLDWSRNPLVALWFSVSDATFDNSDGAVYRLNSIESNDVVCPATNFELAYADECKCGRPVHMFTSPKAIERSERQHSIFTITTFRDSLATIPVDNLVHNSNSIKIKRFDVASPLKAKIRQFLSNVGLDPYSIYGDPDSFGEKLRNIYSVENLQKPITHRWKRT